MTRYTRAVILFGGWLLMQPPPTFRSGSSEPDYFDSAAPITRWTQVAAYATAKKCEAVRAKREQDNRVIFAKENTTEEKKFSALSLARDVAGRCVPAESVHPPHSPEK